MLWYGSVSEAGAMGRQQPDVTENVDDVSGWLFARLGDIAEVTAGGSAPQGKDYFGGPHAFVRVQHLDNGTGPVTRWNQITNQAVKEYGLRLFPAGTILVPKSGASIRLEKRGILKRDSYVVSHLSAIIPNEALVDRDFLFFALATIRFAEDKAGGYPTLGLTEIRETDVPLPSLPEQRAVASVLDRVQQAKAASAKVIAATREVKWSIMAHLFTKGPVSIEEADRVETRETYLGPIPAHWQVRRLDQSAIIQSGVTKGRKLTGRVIEVPYLRVANVQDGFLDLREIKSISIKEGELERYQLRPGDVLFTEGGDIDKLGRGHIWQGEVDACVHQNHIFAVRPQPELLSPEYLSYFVQSAYGKSYFLRVGHRTTHLASINRTKLGALPVPVPTREEQQDIVRVLSAVDSKIEAEVRHRDLLSSLFATLLSELMTGRRRVGHREVA
jgi:type I restriction enzyme S subunit